MSNKTRSQKKRFRNHKARVEIKKREIEKVEEQITIREKRIKANNVLLNPFNQISLTQRKRLIKQNANYISKINQLKRELEEKKQELNELNKPILVF